MKIKLYIFFIVCSLATTAVAETQWDYMTRRHEVRVGWGDQLFESLMWHNPTHVANTMPVSYQEVYHENYRHNQHVWAEYQWRYKHWFSVGGMIDVSEVGWDDVTRNGKGAEIARDEGHYFYNIVIMPTIRFTYFHHEYVNLYSGIGIGLGINGGTEKNMKGKNTDFAAATNITILGLSANYDRWFFSVDFGGMSSLKDANTIFMAATRIINIGIGARF